MQGNFAVFVVVIGMLRDRKPIAGKTRRPVEHPDAVAVQHKFDNGDHDSVFRHTLVSYITKPIVV